MNTPSSFFIIDFGGTTIDIIRKIDTSYVWVDSFLSNTLASIYLEDWILDHHIAKQVQKDRYIRITGGKSSLFPPLITIFHDIIRVESIGELEAIARGAQKLSPYDHALAVSIGTGTAMVEYDHHRISHVKGTGMGGGTLIGLARAMINENITFSEVEALASIGNTVHVDLSVGDIIGSGIGMLPATATASNFAKYNTTSSVADMAAGIINMVSESIVSLAIEKSMRLGNIPIVVGGKGTHSLVLQQKMYLSAMMRGVPLYFPSDAGIMTAIGAAYY